MAGNPPPPHTHTPRGTVCVFQEASGTGGWSPQASVSNGTTASVRYAPHERCLGYAPDGHRAHSTLIPRQTCGASSGGLRRSCLLHFLFLCRILARTACTPEPAHCYNSWGLASVGMINEIQDRTSPEIPPPPLSIPPRGGGVTWPMNDKKSTGNHRRPRRRIKFLVGYTRIQVTVVWFPSPPPWLGGTVIW